MTTRRFYYKQNRLKQLRAFCHAVRTQSISKAAERMHLSQPTVSLQIKALEQEMDTVLFERRGPRITLTPEGRALYELASPLVEGIDNLPDTFAERCGNFDAGEVHIAAGESTILYLLPGFVERFAAEYPGVEIRLHNVTAAKDSSGCGPTVSTSRWGRCSTRPATSSTGRSSPTRPCSSRRAITR